MKINIIQISNNNSISNDKVKLVSEIVKKHAKIAESLLPFKIDNFTITLYAWERDGVSAFTQAKDWVDIKINYKQFETTNKNLLDQLIYIVYHEMHHACREYAGIMPKNKEHILINSVISEGLADHFALEQYSSKYLLDTKNYNLSEIEPWFEKFGKIMWNKERDDDSWLYGGKEKPKMLGYKIGRYIISEVKKKNPKLNSINLIKSTPEKILKSSGINL